MSEVAKMRLIATGLLLLMTGVFVGTFWVGENTSWMPLVRAFSEAAMVGALADWFAVTALFRRPLGLPIPHTAILPRNKERIATNLGAFIESNFLDPVLISKKLDSADPAGRIAAWLALDENSRLVSEKLVSMLPAIFDTISHEEIRSSLERSVSEQLRKTELAPVLGRVLEVLILDGRHQTLLDELVRVANDLFEEHRGTLREKVTEESPWFIPGFVDQYVFDRIVNQARKTFRELQSNPIHPLRSELSVRILNFVRDLRTSPEFRQIGEIVKREMLESDALRDYIGDLLETIRGKILKDIENEDSLLRRQLFLSIRKVAETVHAHESLRSSVNGWIRKGIMNILSEHSHEISRFIAETVRGWETGAMVEKIEGEIGRDLQFIRINGTVVGGLAGVIIYLASAW